MNEDVREHAVASTGETADHRANDGRAGASSRARITIVVPAKNEEETLPAVLADLKRVYDDILVVDGHSRDRTVAIATAAGARVISDSGRGKGEALRRAAEHVTGEVTVFFDADGSHAVEDIQRVVAPILSGEADLVIASRMRGGSDELHGTPSEAVRLIGSTVITQFINTRFGVQLTDYQNGFRAIRTDVLRRLGLREDITTIEQEMAMRALALGFRVTEVPSHEYSRRGGTSKINVLKVAHKYVWQVARDSFLRERRDSVRPCPACGSSTRARLRALENGVDLLECQSCSLVHVWPFPDPAKLAELYAGDYFERRGGIGGYVDYEASSDLKRRSCERILSKVETRTGLGRGRILDVGTANGLLLDVAARRGWQTAGIEPNEQASNVARVKGHDVVCGALPGCLDSLSGEFDLVTMLDVVEHLPDPLSDLQRLRGRLRRGGRLVVVTPDYGGVFRPVMGRHWPHLKPEEHLWYFRRQNIVRLFERAGFNNVSVQPFFKTTSIDHLLADFSKHTGPFGQVSRSVRARTPSLGATAPLPMYLDEMLAMAEA